MTVDVNAMDRAAALGATELAAAKGLNILLADDDDTFSEILSDYLVESGHEVQVAMNGLDALDRFRRGSFQLVFADVNMPLMDGIELLKRIKGLDPHALIVIVTGNGSMSLAAEAIRSGACEFLTKPIKFDEVDTIIQRFTKGGAFTNRHVASIRGISLALLCSIPFWLLLGAFWMVKRLL